MLGVETSRQIVVITGGEIYLRGPEQPYTIYDEVPELKVRANAFFD